MASKDQLQRTLFKAVYTVLKDPEPPGQSDFLTLTVAKLKLEANSPTDWKTFWAEILTAQIDELVQSEHNRYIASFDHLWFQDGTRTMQDLVDHIYENQREITRTP